MAYDILSPLHYTFFVRYVRAGVSEIYLTMRRSGNPS